MILTSMPEMSHSPRFQTFHTMRRDKSPSFVSEAEPFIPISISG